MSRDRAGATRSRSRDAAAPELGRGGRMARRRGPTTGDRRAATVLGRAPPEFRRR